MERWQSWSIASDLKSDEVQASVGSNPTFSVKKNVKKIPILFKNIRPRDEIKTVYRPRLRLVEPSFDNVEKLQKIKDDVSCGACSDVVFREGLVLNIETGASLLIDGNNLCKTIKKISVYDNSRGEFIEILASGSLDLSNLHLKISLVPNIDNLNYIIHSKKGVLGSEKDGEIVQGVLQVVLRKLLTSTNTFTFTNVITKTDRLFRKDVDNFSDIRTISDLMILSFDEAKLLYNNYWAELTKSEKRNWFNSYIGAPTCEHLRFRSRGLNISKYWLAQ